MFTRFGSNTSDSNSTKNESYRPAVDAGLTAATTQTQGNGAITVASGELNCLVQVSTCANANDAITLPAAVVGRSILVANDGAQTLRIWPASGENLGAGADTATTLATTARARFTCAVAGTYIQEF